jgi:ankyrin repeat protein
VGDGASSDFALEAARLGSITGKTITLLWCVMNRKSPPIDNREDITLIGNQLLRIFEEERCRTRVIGKTFTVEGADADIRELFSAAISGQAVRLGSLLSGQYKDRLNIRLHGFNLLHAASEYGQVIVLRLLIHQFGMDPDELNDSGVSAIALAVRAMEPSARSALLALKADFKTMLSIRTLRYLANYAATTPILEIYNFAVLPTEYPEILEPFPLQAYLDGDLAVIPETEKDDDEPNLPPIFAAILGDNINSLRTLLELGCSRDIHTKFSSGCLAPIHVAANLRPLHLALLLHYGALPDLRTKDINQWTALHLACNAHTIPKYKHPSVETKDLLPEDSPLCGLLGLQPEDYLDAKLCTIRLLVKEYGADINAQDWVGSTAVSHCMSLQGDLDVARYLVEECEANIHIKDFRGLSCIHRAVIGKAKPEYVEFCVENRLQLVGLWPLVDEEGRVGVKGGYTIRYMVGRIVYVRTHSSIWHSSALHYISGGRGGLMTPPSAQKGAGRLYKTDLDPIPLCYENLAKA